jgi:hypothetical protein
MKDAWKNYLLYVISKPLKCLAEKDFETFKIYKPNSNTQSLHKIGYLECFARIFSSISPWLSHEVNPILDDVLKCFEHTLPYFDDLDLFSVRQSLVECGYICYGFLISAFWNKLSDSAKENLIKYVKKARLLNSEPWQYKMNWLLFHMIIEVFLKSIGSDYDNTFIINSIDIVNKWYCGDGFYMDGNKKFKMDYYNSYTIQPFFIEILKAMKHPLLPVAIERCILYSEFLERIIGEDGSYPPLGRSIVYRFGTFHLLSYCILNGHISKHHSYGQLQQALTKVIKKSINHITEDGFLTLGFTGKQESLADPYSNTGSCYLTCLIFLPLGLSQEHEFWTSDAPFTQMLAWNNKPFVKYIIDNNDKVEKL